MTLNDARVATLLGWLETLEYHCDQIIVSNKKEEKESIGEVLDQLVDALTLTSDIHYHYAQKYTLVIAVRQYFEVIDFEKVDPEVVEHLKALRKRTRAQRKEIFKFEQSKAE